MSKEISPATSKVIMAAIISKKIRPMLLADPNSIVSQNALSIHNDGVPVGYIPDNELFFIQSVIENLDNESQNH